MKGDGKHIFNQFCELKSQESFTDFFNFYFTRLNRFAFTIVKSELLAEEVVLDVFLKLWTNKEKLESIHNIETYLFISVRNTAVDTVKKEHKFSFDMLEDSHIQLADYKQSPEHQLIEGEMLDKLNQAVNQLPSQCKIIFKLIREDGFNRNEAAQILNISPKTIDNQITIAVKKIAEHLQIDLSNPQHSGILTSFLFTL